MARRAAGERVTLAWWRATETTSAMDRGVVPRVMVERGDLAMGNRIWERVCWRGGMRVDTVDHDECTDADAWWKNDGSVLGDGDHHPRVDGGVHVVSKCRKWAAGTDD